MHQQVPAPDAHRHREHDVLEFLRGDGARIWDWDVDVGDFRSSVNRLFPAERNHGCDALRIGTRQLLRILKAAEIDPFPNPRHLFPRLRFLNARPSSELRSETTGLSRGWSSFWDISRKLLSPRACC